MLRVAIGDADGGYAAALACVLVDEPDVLWVGSAGTVAALVSLVRTEHADAVAVDVRLPGGGLVIVATLLRQDGHQARIVAMAPVLTPTVRCLADRVGATAVAKADAPALVAALMAAAG